MTFAEFINNDMALVAVTFGVIMVGFCIALAMQSNEPTPEYTRIMNEHEARMAEWEAGKPERLAVYAAKLEVRRAEVRANITARRIAFENKYNVNGK